MSISERFIYLSSNVGVLYDRAFIKLCLVKTESMRRKLAKTPRSVLFHCHFTQVTLILISSNFYVLLKVLHCVLLGQIDDFSVNFLDANF